MNLTDSNLEASYPNYTGRWIALLNGLVIGQGGTPQQALSSARVSRFKEIPQVYFVPSPKLAHIHPLVETVASLLPNDISIHLVGGAVRDLFLERQILDFDFVVPKQAIKTARRIADQLNGVFYPLDDQRDYGRVILSTEEGEKFFLDFTPYEGQSIEDDLLKRDFSINAMAVSLHGPRTLIDPTSGLADIQARKLRTCTQNSISDDPIRIIRGIRFAAAFKLHILPETRDQMRSGIASLTSVSVERIRDELFHILENPRKVAAIQAMDRLGILAVILPELVSLKDLAQPPPHTLDVWQHTLNLINDLDLIISLLLTERLADQSSNSLMDLLSLRFGKYRERMQSHFAEKFVSERGRLPLLFLAALFHDIGKPETRKLDSQGNIHFYDHEKAGKRIISKVAERFALSNREAEYLQTVVGHHLRPLMLAQSNALPSKRAIHRFFRDTGQTGVDICMLSLADLLATHGTNLSTNLWEEQIDVVEILLRSWWEETSTIIAPVPLLSGDDLMAELCLDPGPVIGYLLNELREAQVDGRITTYQEAIAYAKEILPPSANQNDP